MQSITKILALVMIFLVLPLPKLTQASSITQPISAVERQALFPKRKAIDTGRAAAELNCINCHGLDGLSDAPGKPHLAGQRTVYLYRALKAFQSGERADREKNHNNFLNEEAMLSTAIYFSSLPPILLIDDSLPTSIKTGDESSDSSDYVDDPFLNIRDSMRKCIKCHDESGNATGSGMPSLTAQDPDYFTTSMMAYVDGSRSHKLMKRLVGKLDEATIRQMGIFYGVQEPQMTETRGEGDARVGRRLAEDCGGCHGDDGNANKASMPTLAGQDAKYFIKAMSHYKDGTRQHKKMFEAVQALSDQETLDLASFYANQQPLRRDVRMPLKSIEWISRCERCHGIDGNSSDPRYPLLAGQDKTYLQASLKAFANDTRVSKTMHAMADPLSAMDIERISSFFASQQPKAVIYMQLPCQDYE